MYNQFLGQTGPRPLTAQPPPVDPNQDNYDFSAGQRANEEALRMGLNDMIRAQVAGTREQARGLAAQGAGMAVKHAYPGFGQAIRGAADYVMAPVKAGVKAAQNYVTGGATTTGAAAAPSTFSTLTSSIGDFLPYAGAAYNTYEALKGIQTGWDQSAKLRSAIRRDPWMTRGQESDLRDDAVDAALKKAQVDSIKGATTGFTVGGPAGGAVGGALGRLGGEVQAFGAMRGSRGGDWKNWGEAKAKDPETQSWAGREVAKKALEGLKNFF